MLYTPEWRVVRSATLERDHYTCQIRGPRCTVLATCADHITPRAQGGAYYDLANLRASCIPCNSERTAAITAAVRQGRSLGAQSRRW